LTKLEVCHRTVYRYRRPVTLQRHRMMVRPRGSHDLKVLAFKLECLPEATISWTQDVYGNLIATADFTHPAAELIIQSNSVLEQTAPEWPTFRIALSAQDFPFAYEDGDVLDLGAFLRPPAFGGGNVEAWGRTFVASGRVDTLSLLKDINAGVLSYVTYRIRDEEGTQSPAETLTLRSGSCRDIAALFIETVRDLGFAARAVSGYLSDPGMVGNDGGSTHAWAEVFLPEAGWISFDPTNKRVGSAHLIPVAIGRCNARIMPVTGGYLGAADDFVSMGVRVDVTPIVG
jgi:transglutaminase-like putative cysteine protease